MAAAVMVMNVAALAFTVIFARILGAADYGSLAALISALIILMVPGSALQIAAAREVSHAIADGKPDPGRGVRRWLGQLCIATVLVAIAVIPLRNVLAAVVNVDEVWAAAAVPVSAMLWAILSVERGALQAFQRYKLVGTSLVAEGLSRLAFGLLFVGAGLEVTGAFLGNAGAFVAVAAALSLPLRHHLPHRELHHGKRLRDLLVESRVPVVALTLLFALQEVHVIVVKHEASDDAAGSYAVAAVAAKAIIWIAVGLGLYLLPEAARRARSGIDARPILLRTLALIGALSIPMLLIFTAAGEVLLRTVFGEDLADASGALPWLGVAMAMLACAYLSVQYLLALGRARFIGVLAVAVVVDVALLATIGADLTQVAIGLCVIQTSCAVTLVTIALRTTDASAAAEDYLPVEAESPAAPEPPRESPREVPAGSRSLNGDRERSGQSRGGRPVGSR
jgi:O-antigen/teichoic acid export membrane protein